MKKTLLIVALSLLIVSGYVVGQAKVKASDDGRHSHTNQAAVRSGDSTLNSNTNKSKRSYVDESNDTANPRREKSEVGLTVVPCGDDAPSCGNPDIPEPKPTPPGPKGSKIVKTGTVEIEIKKGEVTEKFDDVIALIPKGGYLEYSETTLDTSTVTVRIPADKLDQVLVALRKVGKITSESVNSQDRTYDSISYDSQLKILAQKEAALNALLAKADEVYEIENIQNQLFNTRQEIETTQGFKNLLDEQVALSTLTITIAEDGAKKQENDRSIIGEAWETSSEAMLTTIAGMMIVLSSLFPLIVLAILIYILIKALRSRRSASKSTAQEEK